MRYSVAIGLFPDNRGTTFISPDIYVGRLFAKLEKDDECYSVDLWYKELGDTPITMLRNRFLRDCEKRGVDYAFMIDSDNKPDLYVGLDPEAKPFWDSSLAFMRDHQGPCVVAAPYCGSPPDEGVHAFRWVTHESNNPNPDFALKTITRHEAMYQRGIQRCAAAATGVMLVDMRGVKKLDHPRFAYEWKDETESEKASTEDVYFTRNLNYVGVPTYINWDSWAGHLKPKMVGKPTPIHIPSVTRQLRRQAKELAAGRNPATDAAVKALAERMQATQKEFERMTLALAKLQSDGPVPSQEPPSRVGTNSRPELPPTCDPATVTPAGMTFLQAGPGGNDLWYRAEEGGRSAAEVVRADQEQRVVDATFPHFQAVKDLTQGMTDGEREAFLRAYPELRANGEPEAVK